MPAGHVLVVDDEVDIRQLIREILEDEGYRVSLADSASAARECMRQERPDLVLLDIWMPGEDGLSLLKSWAEPGLAFPVVIMSGHGTIETAVEATRLGAWDFIEKPLSLAKLLLTIERSLEASRLRVENAGLRSQLAFPNEPTGGSAAMQLLRAQLDKLAGHPAPVLMQGEPGSGKEGLARWLHARGPRRDKPFVVAAPAMLSAGNAVHLLFGSESADGVQAGLIEQAHGGTLYLDDIAVFDAQAQTLLAEALTRGELMRVGGRDPVRLDVRVIAAISQPLEARLADGSLREDLFFLLNVVPVAVPALRDRAEDIPELLSYYGDFYANRDRLGYRRFGVSAQNRLRQHAWPGNLRELRNLVQRLLLLGGGDVSLTEVDSALIATPGIGPRSTPSTIVGVDFDKPLREAREDFERVYLQHKLREAGGSVGKLAGLCGLERTHLYRKLKDLGIEVRVGAEAGGG